MVHSQMKINGLVVCVNYSDWLTHSISRWYNYLDSLTVVTDLKDLHTAELISRYPGIKVHPTNTFYANGAMFNKGAAMEEARLRMPWKDWILFFDADVVPEPDWYTKLTQFTLKEDTLYGCYRHQCDDISDIDSPRWRVIPDAPCDGGYFHLFHSSRYRKENPLLETCWPHAGVYDSHFKERFPMNQRVVLPLRVTHLGEPENWCGRGNKAAMRELLRQRVLQKGYQHERLP